MTYQKQIGKLGEEIAAKYLLDKGYQLLDQNFNVKYGEIDLVALDKDCVVFVEVKTRTSAAFGNPEDSVTPAKIERMQNAALLWMQAHTEVPDDWRMDVIAIVLGHENDITDLQHFVNTY
jgi:putative endonuclease